MRFEALYYADRLRVINALGDVGVVTLWSQVDAACKIFEDIRIDLSPETSRIAVIANLYGNGLPHMLRNLLWNPQVRYIVVLGKNLSGSREWLLRFFEEGLEEVDFLGSPAFRIKGTDRILDGQVMPPQFNQRIQFSVFGDVGDSATKEGVRKFFDSLPAMQPCTFERVSPPPLQEPSVNWFPSEPRSHTIVRSTPLDAWTELMFRLVRFGHRNKVAKRGADGQHVEEERIELQNVKVIIQEPREEPAETLAKYGFTAEGFRLYQERILDPVKPDDLSYTYGNRLRGYFHRGDEVVDSLEIAGHRLRKHPGSRHAYISLWDNSRDLPVGGNCPCFVSAFFRRFETKLTLTATFRSHNATHAWPENVYGLMAIQRFVAQKAEMEVGPITVISHSIGIDGASLDRAKQVAESKISDEVLDPTTGKYQPRFDPNGDFTVTVDRSTWEIVVEHSYRGMAVHQYRGKSAEELERKLARDVALSEIAHALYLGREIARKEVQMKADRRKAEQVTE